MKRAIRAALAAVMLAGTLVVAMASPASASFNEWCWHRGTFRDGTIVMRVDWDGGGSTDECFGIAPDRTIWHDWATSGGWQILRRDGRADCMAGWAWHPHTPYRRVYVGVVGYGLYSTELSTVTGEWQPWRKHSPNLVCLVRQD
jgi:hypothetical protein